MEKAWMDSSFREYASSSTRKRDSTFKEGEMTKEDVIRMAREAGEAEGMAEFVFHPVIERFATLVASAEREACAKVCDEFLPLGNKCAYAIRARGQA
jgi:hypothetical protein